MTGLQHPVHVVCSYCGATISEGRRDQPTSHGVCPTCFDREMAALDKEDA